MSTSSNGGTNLIAADNRKPSFRIASVTTGRFSSRRLRFISCCLAFSLSSISSFSSSILSLDLSIALFSRIFLSSRSNLIVLAVSSASSFRSRRAAFLSSSIASRFSFLCLSSSSILCLLSKASAFSWRSIASCFSCFLKASAFSSRSKASCFSCFLKASAFSSRSIAVSSFSLASFLSKDSASFFSFLSKASNSNLNLFSLSSDSILSFITSNSISCCGLKAVRGETGCATTGATCTTGNKILMNAFCISTLLIPLVSISLPASSSLSSSADNSRTSSRVSPCSNIGVAIMREHDKHAKLDQQNSQNCRNRTVEKNRDPEYLVLQKLKHLIALWKNFQKIYQPNNLNAKCNLLLKISHSQTLKLLNEYVRNLLFKIIRTTPQALNKCVRNRLLTIIRTTNFEQLFFKLLRNERISRCAIYFERLSAEDYSNCITPLRGKKKIRGSSESNMNLCLHEPTGSGTVLH